MSKYKPDYNLEITVKDLLSILDEYTTALTMNVIMPVMNMEMALERNVHVGKMLLVEELKSKIKDLAETAAMDALDDNDL